MGQAKMLLDRITETFEHQIREQNPKANNDEIKKLVDERMEALANGPKKPLPGLKNETKAAKDEYEEDPTNFDRLNKLGQEYYKERKFKEACNLMIRGLYWSAEALKGQDEERLSFLLMLVHSSCENQKYRQAEKVMDEARKVLDAIGKDAEIETQLWYYQLGCRTWSELGQSDKCNQSFCKGIELISKNSTKSQDEEDKPPALAFYSQNCRYLKKAKVETLARSHVESKCPGTKNKQMMDLMDNMADVMMANEVAPTAPVSKPVAIGVIIVCLIIMTWMLFEMESRSLKSLNLVAK